MKRVLLYTIALLICLAPAQASFAMKKEKRRHRKHTHTHELSILDHAQKWFNVPNLFSRFGVILSDTPESSWRITAEEFRKRESLIAIIRALRLEEFPLHVKKDGKEHHYKAKRYFNCAALKELLTRIIMEQYQTKKKSDASKRAASYLEELKNCLRTHKIKNDFGKAYTKQFLKNLDAAIDFYNGKKVDLQDCLTLTKLPPLFGIDINEHCNVPDLAEVINSLLQREPITKEDALQCVKFGPLLTWLGFKKKNLDELEPVVRGMIALAFDSLSQDSKKASEAIFAFFTQYGKKEAKKDDESDDESSSSSSSSESSTDDDSKNKPAAAASSSSKNDDVD